MGTSRIKVDEKVQKPKKSGPVAMKKCKTCKKTMAGKSCKTCKGKKRRNVMKDKNGVVYS